jgi:hypothetical protein
MRYKLTTLPGAPAQRVRMAEVPMMSMPMKRARYAFQMRLAGIDGEF